jgi:hypothetical protein
MVCDSVLHCNRLVIRATSSVSTPVQNSECQSASCYAACGDISPYDTQGLQYKGSDQILRFFFLNMSQLTSFVGTDAQRVFVYAQTVLIDADLTFPFSLLIHTRQLIINRRYATKIRVNGSTPAFNLDFNNRYKYGVQIDSMFMKQSFMCARILLDSGVQANINTGWAILDDLSRTEVADVEQSAWLSAVFMFNSYLAGINRQNIHFVPFYSKSYYSSVLQQYYNRITVYKTDFDALVAGINTNSVYLQTVKQLLTAYDDTSVANARETFKLSLVVLASSNASLYQLKSRYDAAREDFMSTGQTFIGRVKRQAGAMKVAKIAYEVMQFVKFIYDIWVSASNAMDNVKAKNRRLEAEAIQREIEIAMNLQMSDLAVSLCDVDATASQLARFINVSNDIFSRLLIQNQSSFDFTKYAGDIEAVVGFKVCYSLNVEWGVLLLFFKLNILSFQEHS